MRYLSKCPHCHTIYRLDLMQMNISQGNMRCARCQQRFDAYRNFIDDPEFQETSAQTILSQLIFSKEKQFSSQQQQHSQYLMIEPDTDQAHYVNDVMQQRIDGSQLNLYTYLNYLELVSPLHAQNKSSLQHYKNDHPKKIKQNFIALFLGNYRKFKKNKVAYYFTWGILNLALVFLLAFQFFYI